MFYVVPIVLSYVLGSITFSMVVGKWIKGTDVREHGSGNAGATNTLRVLGVGPAILVLVLDLAKGILAVWMGKWLIPNDLWIAVVCGLVVVIGHNWPVFFAFKGGKGMATTIGVMLTLSFVPTLIASAIAIIIIALTRYVSLGSLLLSLSLPILLWFMDYAVEILLLGILFTLFAFIRHKSNIAKLFQGQENKLGARQ